MQRAQYGAAKMSTMLRAALPACFGCMPAILALPSRAQDYPVRPIRLVVPWPPGGGVDIAARTIQPTMAEYLGQPLVVDNRPGASGVIGAQLPMVTRFCSAQQDPTPFFR